jgi:4-amino-4-deoxy-L-arabinose transferase-like glycosyltransferase
MKILNDIKLPLLILTVSGAAAVWLLPFFPVDETRYLAVAWEMKLNHSIVPLLNGSPYSHKPPFLFLLINLDWLIFGVNEKTLRFIPVLFSVLNIFMTHKIALALWKDEKIAGYATTILASTLIYLVWSILIMFDIVLTFFVLVGIYGLLSAASGNVKTALCLVPLSIGGGLLTKGPVVFAYVLPISILYFTWKPENGLKTSRWYLMMLGSVFIGAAIALLWAIPAAMRGGEAYRQSILWGQTVGRLASSFAHRHPVWWYIPMLPGLLFPWILVKPTWRGFSMIQHDASYRFLAVWMLATIIIFSLISGKQMHYLIPMLPAASLLIAKNIAGFGAKISENAKLHYPVAIFYTMLGGLILGAPFIKTSGNLGDIPFSVARMPAAAFLCLGGMLFVAKPLSIDTLMKTLAVSSLAALIIAIGVVGSTKFGDRYDVSRLARMLNEKQKEGYHLVHYGEYHGQYQFLGRLTQPLIVLKNKASVDAYLNSHQHVFLIARDKHKKIIHKSNVIYQQRYRGGKVVVMEFSDKIQSSG